MATSMLSRQRCSFARAASQKAPRMVAVVARAQQQQQQQQPLQLVQLSSIAKPALVTAVANILMAMPAAAEAGKLFDFDLTLPVMASEFLLLMVFLDKAWFGPVGRVLDERDKLIRDKLASVKDNAGDTDALLSEAEGIVRAARADVSQMVNKQKAEKQAELDAAYAKAKSKINDEVNAAIANMDKESGAMLKTLDAQVDKIANEVLRRVLPSGVKV